MIGRDNKIIWFKGNVLNPLQFVFSGILLFAIGLFIVIVSILGYIESYKEIDYNDLNQIISEFDINEKKTDSEYTYLLTKDNIEYYIPTKAIINISELEKAIYNKTKLTFVCDDKFVYEICDSQGIFYAKMEYTTSVLFLINQTHCVISIILFTLIMIFIAFSAYILSNAPKYPFWANLLVRKGSRNW